MPEPAPTGTPIPAPTHTPAPAVPLSGPGPWMLAEQSVRNYAADSFDRRLFLMSEDGREWSSLSLPQLDDATYHWVPLPAPAGGYVALLPVRSDRSPLLERSALTGSVYILKLPENRVVRVIPLLGEAGWAQVEKEKQDPAGPTLAGLVTDEWNFHWSADGRYLAFPSAASSSMAEVTLYDTHRDSLLPLARSAKHLVPWSWSPDGQSLLYQEIEQIDPEYRMPQARVDGVFSVDLDGLSKPLYRAGSMEQALWLSPDRLLVYEIGIYRESRNLREMDLAEGDVSELYPETFAAVFLSTGPRTVLLHREGGGTGGAGIYRLNLETRQTELLIPCDLCAARLDGANRRISLEHFAEGQEGLSLHDAAAGRELARFPKGFLGTRSSPDDKWLVVHGYDRSLLLDQAYGTVKELPGDVENGLLWRSDSSGFYTEENGSIVFYGQENGWQPAVVRPVMGRLGWWMVSP